MCDGNSLNETAKAVQEVAKTTGKAIGAAEKVGGFISRYVGGSLKEGMGILEDKLKFARWERKLVFMQRAEDLQRQANRNGPTRAIPLKLAVPLLEAASLEDDDYLQDLWARLLVNAANANSNVKLQRAHISILEQLTPLEAAILQKIYSLPYDEMRHEGVEASRLPDEVSVVNPKNQDTTVVEPSEEIKLGLANLARVGCIVLQKSWGGGELFNRINPTLLGKTLVEACTLQTASDS